jgi:hypothetical protein
MAAYYPSAIAPFIPKVNVVDLIQAADPNSIQDEVVAIESVIGLNPATSTAPSSSGTFISSINNFSTIKARLENIETGIVADTHTQYVKRAGGSVITPSAISVVGLKVEAVSGQTADLQQWKDSSGNVVSRVTANGVISINNAEVVGGVQRDFVTSLLLGGM